MTNEQWYQSLTKRERALFHVILVAAEVVSKGDSDKCHQILDAARHAVDKLTAEPVDIFAPTSDKVH